MRPEPGEEPTSVGRSTSVTTIVLAALISSAPPAGADDALAVHMLEWGAGAFAPLNSEQAGDYGSAPVFTLGYAPLITDGETRLILDIGVLRSRGKIAREDPTFESDDATYWLLPVSLGVRTDLTRWPHPGPVRFFVGAGVEWVSTWWRAPFQDWQSSPSPGLLFEARPEFRVSRTVGIWTRARFAFRTETRYEDRRSRFDYSGGEFQLGLSYAPR